jgi:hypothetical protein
LTGAHEVSDDTSVVDRTFTSAEANALLPEVEPLAREMVAGRQRLEQAQERQEALAARIAGNGGGIPPKALAEAQEAVEHAATEIARCIGAIQELGAVVKDLELGLVDFPSLRDGEEVLLCWKLGEDEIAYWHGHDEGFAGRKPL